ncbi:E3 ubiquitin-protein ligase, partial [Gryllus bimaculatus]
PIKDAFGYFTSRGVEVSNASAENGSESTISKYNLIKHAGAAVGTIKGAFGYLTSREIEESNASAENGSESTISKYNRIKHAGSAVGLSLPQSNGVTDPKSALDGLERAARTDGNFTCCPEALGTDSSNAVQVTSSSDVSVALQSGTPSPVLNTIVRDMIASALRSSDGLTRNARFTTPVSPAFAFGHPHFSVKSSKDVKGDFPSFGATISGALNKAYFPAKEGLFPGSKEVRSQETQTEEHITSEHYDFSNIWSMLECPVCFEMILPPAYQCKEGHIACESCWSKIPLPCKYRAGGCFETVLFNSKFAHEERCSFRIIYQCPIDPVIRAATNQLDFNYSLEVCDHNETRKEYFKGCVLPMETPTEEIINTGKYLLLSDLILKTINAESPIMIVVRIWKNV